MHSLVCLLPRSRLIREFFLQRFQRYYFGIYLAKQESNRAAIRKQTKHKRNMNYYDEQMLFVLFI